MNSVSTGRQAEAAAADYLREHGFLIVGQNLRTRTYEIDIIAEINSVLYFVEVKYRKHDAAGGGMEYITERKLRQMQFAAESWLSENSRNEPYRLSGLEVSGEAFSVSGFIGSLT